MNRNHTNLALLIITILVYIWSAIKPHSYFVWFLETFPTYAGAVLIYYYRNKFSLSNLLYRIILIHMMVLAVGGHYTYAEVPLFNDIKEIFNLNRNEYDKIGHLFQGITPALLMHEILLRKTNLKNNLFIATIAIATALGFSAVYEIIEWIVAVSTGEGVSFISLQGDEWDTQKDMFTALVGALLIMIFLNRIHKNEIKSNKKISYKI